MPCVCVGGGGGGGTVDNRYIIQNHYLQGIYSVALGFELQSNFNGSNTLGTMKISSRQEQIEPSWVDNSARSADIIRTYLIFYNMKVCCVFSLESPH